MPLRRTISYNIHVFALAFHPRTQIEYAAAAAWWYCVPGGGIYYSSASLIRAGEIHQEERERLGTAKETNSSRNPQPKVDFNNWGTYLPPLCVFDILIFAEGWFIQPVMNPAIFIPIYVPPENIKKKNNNNKMWVGRPKRIRPLVLEIRK